MKSARLTIRIIVGALLLVLIASVLCRHIYLANLHGVPSLAIRDDQISDVTIAARAGDAKAAARLGRHYLEKRDYRASWIWMQRAKRLGDPTAEANLTEMRKFFPPNAIADDSDETR
jgi:hypothetical protein